MCAESFNCLEKFEKPKFHFVFTVGDLRLAQRPCRLIGRLHRVQHGRTTSGSPDGNPVRVPHDAHEGSVGPKVREETETISGSGREAVSSRRAVMEDTEK